MARAPPLKEVMAQLFQVNPSATSLHQLRAAPSLEAKVLGCLEAYDVIEVAQVVALRGQGVERWAQITRHTAGRSLWTLVSDMDSGSEG